MKFYIREGVYLGVNVHEPGDEFFGHFLLHPDGVLLDYSMEPQLFTMDIALEPIETVKEADGACKDWKGGKGQYMGKNSSLTSSFSLVLRNVNSNKLGTTWKCQRLPFLKHYGYKLISS